jgi:hypothetical protein
MTNEMLAQRQKSYLYLGGKYELPRLMYSTYVSPLGQIYKEFPAELTKPQLSCCTRRLPAYQIHYFIINDISFHFCEELTAEVGLRIAKRSIRQTQARSFTTVPLRKILRMIYIGMRS